MAPASPPPPRDDLAWPKGKKKKRNKTEQELAPGLPPFLRHLGVLPHQQATTVGQITPHGRVFVRSMLERHYEPVIDAVGATHDQRVNSLDFSIPTARGGLFYQGPVRWLSADVELELTNKPELKDAWLRARFQHFTSKLGQFKMPFSAIEMESPWDLPLASRGLLHDLIVKKLQVAGRRPGVTLGAHTRGKTRIGLTLGTFQGSVLVDDDPDKRKIDLLSEQSTASQSLVARAELTVRDFVVGLGYESRIGTPALLATKRYSVGGLDLTLDTELGGLGLRVWAEGMVGSSWLENWYKPPDTKDTTFAAARLVTAVRFGGRHRGDRYIEPYGMVGVLDPDSDVSADIASEEVIGVNVGLWKLVRLGVEAELQHVERNFPQTYYLGDDPDRIALVVQAGVQF